MNIEQLKGRYLRLKRELAAVYTIRPLHRSYIDRLVDDLAATESEIAASHSAGAWLADVNRDREIQRKAA